MRIENPGAIVFEDEDEIRALLLMAEFAIYYADGHSIACISEEYRMAAMSLAKNLLALRLTWTDEGKFRG
jgi:hypothetical protein